MKLKIILSRTRSEERTDENDIVETTHKGRKCFVDSNNKLYCKNRDGTLLKKNYNFFNKLSEKKNQRFFFPRTRCDYFGRIKNGSFEV